VDPTTDDTTGSRAAPTGALDAAMLDQLAAELLTDPSVRANPFGHYRTLRENDPLHGAGFGPLWFATRYDDCHTVLRHPDTAQPPTVLPEDPEPGSEADRTRLFGRRDGRDADPNVAKSLLRLNPPDHTRLRGLVSRGFTPRRVEKLRPAIADMTDTVLDALADAGTGDLLDLVAFPLPVRVIGELVGVPEADRDQFRSLVRAAATSLEPGITDEQMAAAAAAGSEMNQYFHALIADKRTSPGDDLISALLGVQADQLAGGPDADVEPLTDHEVVATVILIFAAGFETTTNLIGNGLWCLLHHRDELQRLRDDRSLAPAAVEEMLRFQSPVQLDARRAIADIEVAGHHIDRGSWIFTLLGAANRDPARFEDPEVFRIVDRPTPVLSFASGIHYCLGASLARIEGQVFFNHLLDRFATIDLVAEPQWRTTLTLRGLEALEVSVR
jgi:cytochrome P450